MVAEKNRRSSFTDITQGFPQPYCCALTDGPSRHLDTWPFSLCLSSLEGDSFADAREGAGGTGTSTLRQSLFSS
jgi:hypothetical protein